MDIDIMDEIAGLEYFYSDDGYEEDEEAPMDEILEESTRHPQTSKYLR